MGQKKGQDSPPTVLLNIRIQPRASRNEIMRMDDGTLKIRLTAPPVDNAANDALVRFLAEMLSVPRSSVEIVSGHTARNKTVRIRGIGDEDIQRLLKTKTE